MLVHKFMMKAGANVVSALLSFVSLMVMTRYVGEQYGIMMWSWAFIALFNAFSDLGFNAANMRFISDKKMDQSTCFSTFMVIKVLMSLLVLFMGGISIAVSYLNQAVDREAVLICLIFMAYFLVYNIQTALSVSYDGRLESGKSSMILTSEYVVRSVSLIILALMCVDALYLSLAYVIGIAVSFTISLIFLRNTQLHMVKPVMCKQYAKFAAPLAFSIMAIAIIEYLDKVMIGIFQGSMEVGYYTAVAGILGAFTTLGASLNNVLLPHLSKTKGDNKKNVENVLWMVEKYISALLLPVLVFFIVLGEPVAIVLFGQDFGPSGDILSIQAVHIYAFILTGLMAQVLYSVDRGRIYMKASIVFAVLSLLGFFIMIPDEMFGIPLLGLGGIGAATSLAFAYTVFAILMCYLVKTETGLGLYPGLWRVFLSGIVTAAFMIGCEVLFSPEGLIELAAVGIIGEGIFLLSLRILKELNKEDIDFLKTAFSLKNLKESASDELR